MHGRGIGVRFTARARYFSLPHSFQAGSGVQQPPIQWYRELFPREESGRGVKLTTHIHLELTSKMVELYLNCPIGIHELLIFLIN
jgi:hypothetical protein